LQETAVEVLAYLQGSVLLSLILAFVAGIAAVKTVARDQRSSVILFMIVGVVGLFLGEYMLFLFNLDEYLEKIAELRIVFDFIAAYVGSFIIAAVIHFVKPT
jgi:uncharacterized membrane protein YeaQ/YmgE (transglycosylase-associated protein family)